MTKGGQRSIRNAYAPRCPHSSCGRESFLTLTTRKFRTQLQSLLRKLLPANTRPRKMASQLRRRIKDPHADYRLYEEAYHLYAEANPPETPRTRRGQAENCLLDRRNPSHWSFHVLFRLACTPLYRVLGVSL